MAPLVTVGITTYRRPKMLATAIRSVLKQTLQDFEVVVCDDNSGDDTEDVVLGFGDPRLRYFRSERNLGQTRNTNRCIGFARGRYFCWNSDDNAYLPTFLERLSGALERHPEVGLAACGTLVCDGELRPYYDDRLAVHQEVEAGPLALRHLLSGVAETDYNPSSVMFRLDLLLKNRLLNENFGDDWAWLARYVYTYGCVRIPDSLLCYRVHETNLGKSQTDVVDPVRLLKLHYEDVFNSVPSTDGETRAYGQRMFRQLARRSLLTVMRNLLRGRYGLAGRQVSDALSLHPLVFADPMMLHTLAVRWQVGRQLRRIERDRSLAVTKSSPIIQ